MTVLARKRELLAKAGFAFDFDRDVYYNRETKKVFSVEFVDDHDTEDLEKLIQELPANDNWRFYFNAAPSESVRRELEGVLG